MFRSGFEITWLDKCTLYLLKICVIICSMLLKYNLYFLIKNDMTHITDLVNSIKLELQHNWRTYNKAYV